MVETISPVGYGARTGRWLVAVGLHALGATATAAAFGAALGGLGALLHAPWGDGGLTAICLLALAYAAREAFGLPIPVPAARRQVPDWWRSFFSWPVAAALYGAGLGIGFLTYLTNGGLVVLAGAAVASGRPAAGALIMGMFGLARGLSPLVAWRVRTNGAGTALVDRLAASDARAWRLINAVALAMVGGAALAMLPGEPSFEGAALATAVLALAFGWSAAAKLAAPRRWQRTVAGYDLPAGVEAAARTAVPVLELAVACAALAGLRPAAGAGALLLLAAFSAAIVRARIRGGPEVACGCFGGTRSRDYRVLLVRNGLLALPAAVVAPSAVSRPTGWPGTPEPGELLPFTLAVAALAVAVLTAWRTAVWLGRGRRP